MTNKDRIKLFLQTYPEGIDDDDLAKALGFKQRQQANARCRELAKEGLVTRCLVNGKIQNFWAGPRMIKDLTRSKKYYGDTPKYDIWFWEGNVQTRIVQYLRSQGYLIRFQADTASHERGIDIQAEKNGKKLWITVKGYPKGTPRTNPSLQAAHWFKKAIFDVIEYRERDKDVFLAVGLPDFPRYHSLVLKILWFKTAANFNYFWVKEDGSVFLE